MKNIILIISLLGILSLLIINNLIEIPISTISEINEKNLNKNIRVIGNSSNVKNYENNFTTFSITDDTGKINVICSCPNVENNLTLEITGRITKYKEELQIQADKIKIVI